MRVDPDDLMSRARAAYERGEYEEWVDSLSPKERKFLDAAAVAAAKDRPYHHRIGSEEEGALYERTGLTFQGPTFGFGLFLLMIAVLPIFLFDSQPWKGIAVANAITHFVTGFAWTMTATRFSAPIKGLGILVWNVTTFLAPILLLLAIIFLIF